MQTVYWETGWSGFTIDAVAKTAEVGRAAIYRRWPSKIELLIAALEQITPLHDPIDTGTMRGDLEELTRQLLSGYQSQPGLVALRVALDARVFPELLEPLTQTISASRFATTRDIVRRGIERGELPATTSVTTLLEMLTGAALSHILFSHQLAGTPIADSAYVERLVNMVLAAADSVSGR
ncbi:TetR/AcrR family transcriptional regulator [Aldersonia kunmingensis]|uniref:TetR/AcrR family transcriptional regulator n=1 Tax=Aldersonia kunmingensis TaxID=408066 RepID=UPI000B1F697E|nr:TetR/AcrR family transcriptional regulator [Aldersonia kunmingensis]